MEICKKKTIPKMMAESENLQIKNATKRLKKIDEQIKKAKTDKTKQQLKSRRKIVSYLAKKRTQQHNKELKQLLEKEYCNPGCKGTLYENDLDIEEYCKKCEDNEKKRIIHFRKTITSGKKLVLDKDSFFRTFNKKTKKKYMKYRAVSGCSMT